MTIHRALSFSVCVALAFLQASARDKAPPGLYDSYTGFVIPAAPVLPAHETHPSLWFKADEIASLKSKCASDDFARSRWGAVIKLAALGVTPPAPPTATDKVETIHKYYGAMSIAARAHALNALLADDEATRAAHRQRATELLLRAYDGPIFDLDSNERGSAVDEIYRGSWLQNYAHAYDCIQPSLSGKEDEAIRERLAREAQCVFDNLYRWTPESPHNHLSKPAWGLGSIALTLSSHPHAKEWLARAIEAANRNTRYFFSGDGLYREGSHYLIFSLTNFLPFLYHYRNVSGVDAFPDFQPVFEAMAEGRNSRGWLPNIADSYIRPTPTHLAASAYRNARTRLHSSATLAEVLMWSYRTCDLTSFEKEQSESGFNYTGASWDYPLEMDELLACDLRIKSTVPDVAPNIFLAGGQSYFRDSWTSRGDGQRFLLFHGVANSDNHEHDDHLSFILEAEGQMMCSDAGYSRGTYAGAERTNWYVTAAAHNTITFDGKSAGDPAPSQTPPSLFRVDEPGLVGEEKEAVFGNAATWRRAIFWIAGDYYVVCDRVSAPRAGAIAAYLHGGRGTLDISNYERTWSYSADRYGRAAKLHAWVSAPGATVSVKQGELTYIKGDFAEFPYLETHATAQACAWLTLLKPARGDDHAAFAAQDRSTSTVTALAITASDHRCLVVAQTKSGTRIKIDDVETDGAFALVRRDFSGRVLGFSVLDATFLSVNGVETWRSERTTNFASSNTPNRSRR